MLKGRSITGVALSTLAESVRRSGATGHLVALTFDDGYQDNLEFALPILNELGFKATVFVIADRVGSSMVHNIKWLEDYPGVSRESYAYLDWEGVAELSRSGVEIGSHTCTHSTLDKLERDRQVHEIGESKRIIEERIGKTVESFCCPSGRFSPETLRLAVSAGYRQAVVTPNRPATTGGTWHTLERVGIYRRDGKLRFYVKASRFFPLLRLMKHHLTGRACCR